MNSPGSSVRTVLAADTSFLLREFGSGAGVPVLLLHGVPETSSAWSALAPRLAVGRRVLAPDLPGLGGSAYGGPYDVPSLVAQLSALVEAEAAGRPVDVVGHDWGGSLALAVAAARPDLVRRVVVISAPYQKVDLTRAWHIPLLGFVPPSLFIGAGRAMVRGMFRYAWKTGRPPQDLVEGYAQAYAAPDRVRAMAGYYRAAVRRRRTEDPRARTPGVRPERSLVVWGTADPPMPLAVGAAVVSDLGRAVDPRTVRMVTLPGVGHWPLEEVPDVVLPILADFLRSP